LAFAVNFGGSMAGPIVGARAARTLKPLFGVTGGDFFYRPWRVLPSSVRIAA
jgi:hypothetical protein